MIYISSGLLILRQNGAGEDQLKVEIDNKTRWNSKFNMCSRLLKEKTVISVTQQDPALKLASRSQVTPELENCYITQIKHEMNTQLFSLFMNKTLAD